MTMEDLEIRVNRLSALLARTLAQQETERRAVTRALQEDIGQSLTAIALNLRVLEGQCQQPQSGPLIEQTRELVSGVLQTVERLQHQLYPVTLDSQGVVPAFEVFIQDFARSAQVRIELDAEILPHRLPADIELTLLRILQDALEHLRSDDSYAEAARVILRLIGDYIYMVIEDDSVQSLKEWQASLMAERAESLGGRCTVLSQPDQGTCIEVILPLAKRDTE